MTTHPSQHVVETIDRPVPDVYAYAADPRRLPEWAAGLSTAIELVDGEWVAESETLGRITVTFADDNPYGVLDHDVRFPDGTVVHNAVRLVPNGDGTDVVFSLFQLPGVTDESFASDRAAVARDLATLKDLLER